MINGMTRMLSVGVTCALMSSPALAATCVAASDLFVDLDQYVGQSVIVEGMEVHGADTDGAIADSQGVTFRISTKGIDKETMRLFLRRCHIGSDDKCKFTLSVTPTDEKFITWPVLTNVSIVP